VTNQPSVIDGLDVNEVKDGLIVYDPSRDRVHYLNATAGVVFTLCDRRALGLADRGGGLRRIRARWAASDRRGQLSRGIRQRRVAEIAVHARFRLLPYEVEVTADDDRVAAKIAYLANHAEQSAPLKRILRYGVEGHGPYEVFEDGERLAVRGRRPTMCSSSSMNAATDGWWTTLSVGGWLPLHGGLVTIAGRRLLVVGQKGAGKSTLMLRLLYDGHAVEGDEMVFTRDGVAVALPRSFHLKPGPTR